MSHVLEVKHLSKVYPGPNPRPAVDDISFNLNPGEILGILGPNGSGKTTTIQMLLGTLSVTSGTISYFGKDFAKNRSAILQDVTYASAYISLPWILTVRENLEIMGGLYGFSPKECRQKFMPMLERFGMSDKLNSPISYLSAGQITRLMLVKAFFPNPKVILLDEPTASLDPDIAKEICDFIVEQRTATGVSILFTSHKMQEVMKLCDRTIFLREGKIIANDLPKKLAESVSSYRLKLTLNEGMPNTLALMQKNNYFYTQNLSSLEIALEHAQIPTLLKDLSLAGIDYENIRIEEPSLEDYFLQISRG